jgi:opacity protein-like surface antigen
MDRMQMKRTALLALAAFCLAAAHGRQAHAQSGFALKGHFIVNATSAQEAEEARQIPTADGFDLGAEYILPFGVGLGVSGYTASEKDSGVDTREFTVLAEANYFLRLPLLPLAPYAGIHAGLGQFSRDDVSDPALEIQDNSRSQIGYQIGIRFQPTPSLGIDGQWRHMSTSAASGQSGRFERNQVLLGVALF